MATTNADLQRKWDDAWDLAPDGANTFRDQLRAMEKADGRLIDKGSVQSFSKNSSAQTLTGFGPGNLTQHDNATAWRELLNLFDQLYTDLVSEGIESPTDEQVYEEGKNYLRATPKECSTDFSGARAC